MNNNTNNDVRPPKVNNNTNNDTQPLRVLQPRAKIHQQKDSQGIRVYRIFGEPNKLVEHCGYICDFDKKEGYYKVKCQDSDTEEYTKNKIGTMLHKSKKNTNIMRELATTKHKQIIEEYATMESIYTPPSKFLKGLSKAIECVEMMALESVNK